MKKTLLYVLALIVLCGSIYYIFFTKHDSNPYGQAEAGFNVRDTAAIGKIFIANYSDQTILAERTDSCWMLNKRFKVMPSMLRMVINTLYQQEVLYPVTKNAVPIALKQLSSVGTKVEVYNRGGGVICKFYVGGTAPNNSGTYMMMEGAKMPYVVHIPGFQGLLNTRFSGMEKDWRDRNIFSIPGEEIKNVHIHYYLKPENSFTISRNNGTLEVKGEVQDTFRKADMNTHNAGLYLNYFADVNCEGYLNGSLGLDSTIRTAPRHSMIDIETIHGQHKHVEVFWMPVNQRSKNLTVSNPDIPDDYDSDRLYALINNNKDTVMIQHFVFKKIFRKLVEFYPKVPVAASPEL